MRSFFIITLLFSSFLSNIALSAAKPKQQRDCLLLTHPTYCPGMFSVFNTVIGVLYSYDKGVYTGLKVDFGREGFYYDSAMGENWWNYYCKPIFLGAMNKHPKTFLENDFSDAANLTENELERKTVNRLINKYIKIKPFLMVEMKTFVLNHFSNFFVIGVHYRGTDKFSEAPRVAYDKVKETIEEYIEQSNLNSYRIFIATDEEGFLQYMKDTFPEKIIAQDSYRSTSGAPIHNYSPKSPFENGKEALMDALLLSKTNVLIRTSSNLSLWSTYFNPDLSVIMLNDRHKDL